MGPIKARLLDVDCGRRRRRQVSGDGRSLVLPLMDSLRNGPYRMCHTASGDVLMCYRAASAITAGSIKKLEGGVGEE